jgi:hypothetical protein
LVEDLAWEEWLEEPDGVREVTVADLESEVDGVEVDFAVKTTSQIRVVFDGREELAALGTEEDESPVPPFVRPVELLDQLIQWDFISDLAEQVVAETFTWLSLRRFAWIG